MSDATPQPALPATAATVLGEILTWSQTLPTWQQDCLRRLVTKVELSDSDFKELLSICRATRGLGRKNGEAAVVPEALARKHVPIQVASTAAATLLKLFKLEHVNALCDRGELDFAGQGVTVVYGDNGSGKSSYAQVLKRACRARNRGEAIKPNVFKPSPGAPARAKITYQVDGKADTTGFWEDKDGHEVVPLSQVSFFDSECASIHVGQDNNIAFTPYGLDVLETLGGTVCRYLKSQLEQEKNRLKLQPSFLTSNHANGTSQVAKELSRLQWNTDLASLKQLAVLTADEEAELLNLKQQQLDPKAMARTLQRRSSQIMELKTAVTRVADLLNVEGLLNIKEAIQKAVASTEAAKLAAEAAFGSEPLEGIGTEIWSKLWDAARDFSTKEAYTDEAFPATQGGARCVLCEQELAPEAAGRFSRFEQFVKDKASQAASSAAEHLAQIRQELVMSGLSGSDLRLGMEALTSSDPNARRQAHRWTAEIRLLRYQATRAIDALNTDGVPNKAATPAPSIIDSTAAGLKRSAEHYDRPDQSNQANASASHLAALEARQWLKSVLVDVAKHRRTLRRVRKLDACLLDVRTNSITTKSKSLAKDHVTDQIRNAFADEMRRMELRRINVELASGTGQYGSTLYKVQLVGASNAKVGQVLSEGEHRAIGLAAFLSELATSDSNSTIIFDDPVTSLDHLWREKFARRLVEEGAKRQIIVFTHDLVFLHDLMDGCRRQKVTCTPKRVYLGIDGVGMVEDDLPWHGKKIAERLQNLMHEATVAKKLSDVGNYDAYDGAATAWYGKLRSACERAIEERFFFGTIRRHRDYIEVKFLKKASVLEEDHCTRLSAIYGKCSGIIDAHDYATGRNPSVPACSELFDDLKELRDVVDEVEALQKNQ